MSGDVVCCYGPSSVIQKIIGKAHMNLYDEDALPLILLPGLGADYRVFFRQAEVVPNIIIPEWLDPMPRESLQSYARRLADQVDPGGPCHVGGLSFGGMLAHYVARHLEAKTCLLIGSLNSPWELPWRYRVLTPVVKYTPWLSRFFVRVAQKGTRTASKKLRKRISANHQSLLRQFNDMRPEWFVWAGEAILSWKENKEMPPAINRLGEEFKVYHIHGQRDPILPCRKTKADVVIPDGGHCINVSRHEIVNRFLLERTAGSVS